jgi:glutamate racemase
MADAPVAFIDSGIGGLPYLAFTRRMAPGERFVHVADRENFPYGEKSAEQITHAVISLTKRLMEREAPKLIVVACNTMSVVALEPLRSRFSVPFVGVVPAVKPAASVTRSKRVGVLATQRTVEGEYLRDLIERYAAGCRVVSISSGDLVDFVERELFHASVQDRRARVQREAERLRAAEVDTVVLACTHFLHLEQEFQAELEGMRIVDSREGVARQVLRILDRGSRRLPGGEGRDSLYLTGADTIEERYRYFAERFSLTLEGTI